MPLPPTFPRRVAPTSVKLTREWRDVLGAHAIERGTDVSAGGEGNPQKSRPWERRLG
jgi:hypothetical protein